MKHRLFTPSYGLKTDAHLRNDETPAAGGTADPESAPTSDAGATADPKPAESER
jgi:hypothetical protein